MAAILGSIVLVGCSSHTNQKLLRVFFTGVDRTNEAPVARSSAVDTNTPAQLAAAAAAAIPRFLHEPFSQRNCTACHVSDMSQELRANTAELCLGCHEKLIGNAKYVHAPVADG